MTRGLRFLYNPRQQEAPERDILSAAFELLRRHPRVHRIDRTNVGAGWLVPNRVYKRLAASGAIRPGEARYQHFGVPGAADLTGMLKGGRRLEVEVKRAGGELREAQLRYGESIVAGGGLFLVVRSLEDVMAAPGLR